MKMLNAFVFLCLLLPAVLNAQVITTYASGSLVVDPNNIYIVIDTAIYFLHPLWLVKL